MDTVSPVFKMDDLIFDVNLYKHSASSTVKIHGHSYIEIMVCTGGECRHIVNGTESTLCCGELFLMHPGWSHKIIVPEFFEHVTLACTKEAPFLLAPELKANESFKKLFLPESADSALLSLSPAEYHVIYGFVSLMLDEFSSKTIGWQSIMRSNFSSFIVQLCRFKALQDDKAGNMSRLADILAYMEKNFRKPIKLKDLARKAGVSQCHLTRLFQKNYGDSPINYLIRMRIDYARKLLLLGGKDLSISEIAAEAGFNDSNYFDRQFKKISGMSPLQYRRHR